MYRASELRRRWIRRNHRIAMSSTSGLFCQSTITPRGPSPTIFGGIGFVEDAPSKVETGLKPGEKGEEGSREEKKKKKGQGREELDYVKTSHNDPVTLTKFY